MSALRVSCLLGIMLVGSLLGSNLIALAITANQAFDAVWSSADQAVQNGTGSYSWFWGPTVHAQRFEPYLNSPGDQREVRYYDKSRMEINDPGGDPSNIYVDRENRSPVRIAVAIRRVMDDPHYRHHTIQVARRLQTDQPVARAVACVEQVAAETLR